MKLQSQLPQLTPPRCVAKFQESMWTDPNFLIDHKLDGGRYLAYVEPKLSLRSRDRNIDRINNFPHFTEYLTKKVPPMTILDTEVVAGTDFRSVLRMLNSSPAHAAEVQQEEGLARLMVFDLPYYKGKDLRYEPLLKRKQILAALLKNAPDFIQPVPYTVDNKREFYYNYVKGGGEGGILKNGRLAYGLEWCRIKYRFDVSVIIVRVHMDRTAIEMGVYQNGQLIKVGDCSTNALALRSALLNHPERYIGQVLDVTIQGFQGASMRSPTWVRMRPDVVPTTVTMEKLLQDAAHGLEALQGTEV